MILNTLIGTHTLCSALILPFVFTFHLCLHFLLYPELPHELYFPVPQFLPFLFSYERSGADLLCRSFTSSRRSSSWMPGKALEAPAPSLLLIGRFCLGEIIAEVGESIKCEAIRQPRCPSWSSRISAVKRRIHGG